MPKQPYSHARRNQTAQALGFKNYAARRKALGELKNNPIWQKLPGSRKERAKLEKTLIDIQRAKDKGGHGSSSDWSNLFQWMEDNDVDSDLYDEVRDWYDE